MLASRSVPAGQATRLAEIGARNWTASLEEREA